MQKSFVVKATLCIEDCQFYLRAGDVLMYDSAAHRLTVYRANDLIKVMQQTPLGISGMLKTGILQEVTTAPTPVVVPALPTSAPAVAPAQPVKPTEEEKRRKRGKAQEQREKLQKVLSCRNPDPLHDGDCSVPALREDL